ncbi:PTS lactose/cellobiose transporter subunit IIA [Clostridium polynesiense]|uniref:PTS lactose/cellobiose transporter subunit IIA n=1 Tax=Clostridium polynesiense TaxID=1325933 RepID=UPI00058B21D9|nr:PTS lactose/cellobiose transporter subunit IIA [Clostridium polynesiense]
MENNELISFDIISNVGAAKSIYMEIINKCEKKDFDSVEEMLEEAEGYLIAGHKRHMELVQKEASGDKVELSLLLMHAEDQLMNAELVKLLAQKFMHLYKEVL